MLNRRARFIKPSRLLPQVGERIATPYPSACYRYCSIVFPPIGITSHRTVQNRSRTCQQEQRVIDRADTESSSVRLPSVSLSLPLLPTDPNTGVENLASLTGTGTAPLVVNGTKGLQALRPGRFVGSDATRSRTGWTSWIVINSFFSHKTTTPKLVTVAG